MPGDYLRRYWSEYRFNDIRRDLFATVNLCFSNSDRPAASDFKIGFEKRIISSASERFVTPSEVRHFRKSPYDLNFRTEQRESYRLDEWVGIRLSKDENQFDVTVEKFIIRRTNPTIFE